MSELLSSTVLERQFGPTELEILKQDEGGRIVCTKVVETGQILELSQVVFQPEGIAAFPEIHREVLAGTSMGKAFAEDGMPFHRDIHASYRYDHRILPAVFAKRFDSGEPPTVTDLSVTVGPDATPYASILEVFSPRVNPWELTGGEMGEAIVDRLEVFGAELVAMDDAA
jgi:hypothetical protein